MKNSILIISLFISGIITAQTKVTVTVASNTFSPSSIVISSGDTVEFINTSGSHWVDGTQTTFSSNPASFDNQSQAGAGWTYKQVLTVAGSYDYRCGIHTSMTGTITVQPAVNVSEEENTNPITFYPNPTVNSLSFNNVINLKQVKIYSLNGIEVLNTSLIKKELDISNLTSGVYFVIMILEKGEKTKKLIIQ